MISETLMYAYGYENVNGDGKDNDYDEGYE